MDRRAFVVVIDACGAGELPDAADYGDAGANTLRHVAEAAGGLELPALQRLGLGNVLPLRRLPARGRARASTAGCTRSAPARTRSPGHWELMGVVAPAPLPHLPRRLPARDRSRSCRPPRARVLCNRAVLDGLRTRSTTSASSTCARATLILYTSRGLASSRSPRTRDVGPGGRARTPPARRRARSCAASTPSAASSRARSAASRAPSSARTGRRDFSLSTAVALATSRRCSAHGVPVHAVGKVGDALRRHAASTSRTAGATNAERAGGRSTS